MKIRNHVAALFLLAPAAITFSALPASVVAQEVAPELTSLQVTSDNGIQPGSRLRFILRGTPGSRALVRIRGVQGGIELTETSRGIYTGRYVVTRDDRIEPGDPIRATLRRGNRTVTASYDIPADLGNVAAAPVPQIERFEMGHVDRFEPGAELRFRLEGAPGGRASVNLPGISRVVPLREVRPGLYEGSYILGRADTMDPAAPVVGRLRFADRVVTANLDRPLVSAQPNLQIQILNHSNNGQIDGSGARVRGRTAPFADVNVRVDAVPPVVGQFGVAQQVLARTVRADANGFFEFTFNSPVPIPGTRYEVSMVASKADVNSEAHLVLFQRQG